MNRRPQPAPLIAPAGVRRLTRNPCGKGPVSPEFAKAVEDALHAGMAIEFYDREGVEVTAFRLGLRRGVVQVSSKSGSHLATFVSTAAAIDHGWQLHARKTAVP